MAQARKVDRRIARTRRALGSALIELALESGYDRISIRDLTERADIGYATFYRHYKSKDELLTRYLGAILQQVQDELLSNKSRYDQSLAAFSVLDKYKDVLVIALNLPREHRAMVPLWQRVYDLVTDLYLARDESVIPLEVSVNHLIQSVSELIRWWLDEGSAYSPEQMARMQTELIISVTEQVAVLPRDAEHIASLTSQREPELSATDAPPTSAN